MDQYAAQLQYNQLQYAQVVTGPGRDNHAKLSLYTDYDQEIDVNAGLIGTTEFNSAGIGTYSPHTHTLSNSDDFKLVVPNNESDQHKFAPIV